MNTNSLKKFAREARIKLLDIVSKKLEYVLSQDTAELRGKKDQISKLNQEIKRSSKQQVVERVAYLWFNRIMALRFMDANGYTNPKVVTPLPGSTIPEILQEAKAGYIDENLKLDRQRLNDLLDGKSIVADSQTEVYKILFISVCNSWNSVMPSIFERISDYTELLMPEDLLSEFSIVSIIREGMSDEDCQQEELIGWLYQFYIADKKDEVFAGLAKKQKITPENIPAATQLFTPRWIVRYMVENSLGRIWMSFKPESKLREFMPYYIESPEGNEPTPIPEGINGVTDITFLDPCMGSGHILVYAFELFTKIYEEEGYNTNEIPELIFKHNLFGMDIDERASQLAVFALTMKARAYYSRFFRKSVKPNLLALENVSSEIIEQAVKIPLAVGGKLVYDHKDLSLYNLTRANNFGSLIQINEEELKSIEIQKGSLWQDKEETLREQAEYLSRKYHCVVTNPPYMTGRGVNYELKDFLYKYFEIGRSDTFAAFILKSQEFLVKNGISGMVTMESWMFLSSFEELRKHLIDNAFILSLSHFGWHVMRIAFGTCSFIMQKKNPIGKNEGIYSYLTMDNIDREKDVPLKFPLMDNGRFKSVNQKDFEKIPGNSICYWVSPAFFNIFNTSQKLSKQIEIRQGLKTGDNNRFLRFWWENSFDKIGFNCTSIQEAHNSNFKWFPYNKGGSFRKWYGNNELTISFDNNSYQLLSNQGNKLPSRQFYFKESLTWSTISGGAFSVRYSPGGYIFDGVGSCAFPEKDIKYYCLGFLNSKISAELLEMISPTFSFEVGQIKGLPFIWDKAANNAINELVICLIKLEKEDWDLMDTSWDFQSDSLINYHLPSVKDCLSLFKKIWTAKYFDIRKMEEELNQEFIKIYGLTEEIKSVVPLSEITILQGKSKILAGNLIINPSTIIFTLISYLVGCVFGRYSLDKSGLILANQEDTVENYLKQIPQPKFLPDEDNIIPILEGEYFSDDIVGRFNEFIKVAFGPGHYEENIKFIEDSIGKDIRKYFVKDFYNDHIKRYKKRPIYWMFSSPKGNFKALIYMHRYRPDTVSRILNDYLRVFIGKLEANKLSFTSTKLSEHASDNERTLADKKIIEIELMLKDCKEYEKTLFEVAAKRIEIDLDDGVMVNYLKFKDVLVPIKGLDQSEE